MIIENSRSFLRKCPFCGGTAVVESWEMSSYEKLNIDSVDGMFYQGWCDDCQSSGPTCLTLEDAIKSWNQRIRPDSVITVPHEFFEDIMHPNVEELRKRDAFFERIQQRYFVREDEGSLVVEIPDIDLSLSLENSDETNPAS